MERKESGKVEECVLAAGLNPNRLPVLGGKGGGVPSSEPLALLGRVGALLLRLVYLARINRSMTESASSASMGMAGFLFSGL